jgi:uncharacterized protein YfbU (UPF0304 family)
MVINLSTSVTGDGLMVITTSKNPGQISPSSNNLSTDSEWLKNFTSEKALELSFLNFTNLKSYLRALALGAGATDTDIQTFMDVLAPLKSLGSTTQYENGYYLGKIKLNLDFSQLEKMQAAFISLQETFGNSYQSDYNMLQPLESIDKDLLTAFGFTDVNENDWFARYVNYMAYMEIMNGYGTEFKPAQNITRAEFVKTLMAAYEKAGYYSIQMEPVSYFSDVPADSWFTPYVNQASVLSIIKGYTDNTFRPNQPINRAEAMTMLINLRNSVNSEYPVLKDLPFTDVRPSDWFYNTIQKAFTLKYATGKTATVFAPGDYLTRAEAAAIISRYIDNN